MRFDQYKKQLANNDIENLIEGAIRASEWLKSLAAIAQTYAVLGEETVKTRRSAKQGRRALDFAEFLAYVRAQSPQAAAMLELGKVLKFDWGRLHLQFKTDREKADLGWHRHTLEALAEKLYGVPLKIIVRQSEALSY